MDTNVIIAIVAVVVIAALLAIGGWWFGKSRKSAVDKSTDCLLYTSVPHSQFGKLLFGGLALRIVRIGEDGHGHSFPPYANRLPLVWKALSATFFDFAWLSRPFISIHYL